MITFEKELSNELEPCSILEPVRHFWVEGQIHIFFIHIGIGIGIGIGIKLKTGKNISTLHSFVLGDHSDQWLDRVGNVQTSCGSGSYILW